MSLQLRAEVWVKTLEINLFMRAFWNKFKTWRYVFAVCIRTLGIAFLEGCLRFEAQMKWWSEKHQGSESHISPTIQAVNLHIHGDAPWQRWCELWPLVQQDADSVIKDQHQKGWRSCSKSFFTSFDPLWIPLKMRTAMGDQLMVAGTVMLTAKQARQCFHSSCRSTFGTTGTSRFLGCSPEIHCLRITRNLFQVLPLTKW